MQDIRELIESFLTWMLMAIGFMTGAFFGFLIFLLSSDIFSFLEIYRLQFCILGAGIGGAQGFTFVKWIVMRNNQKVWQRLDWTKNAIKIPSVICDLSIILSSTAVGAFLLKCLDSFTVNSDFVIVGRIGAIIGAVIALRVILLKKTRKLSFVKMPLIEKMR